MGVSSRRRIARTTDAVLAISLCAVFASAQQRPKVLAPHEPVAPKVKERLPLPPAKAGSIAGGPWIVDASFQSTIYLKNSVETSPITVTPVLHLSDGRAYSLQAVKLEPSGIATVDINAGLEKLGIVPNSTLSGWVELQYNWPWAPLCAFIRDLDTTHSVVFTFGFAPLDSLSPDAKHTAASQVTDGLWWKQEHNVSGFVALANTTSRPVTAVIGVSDNQGKALGAHTVTIAPRGMETVDLRELDSASVAEGGIRVSYTGEPDALLISGGLQDPGVGYSANLPFAPPPKPIPPMAHRVKQQGIAELGLMTGASDPLIHFPAGTTFTPYSVLRNVSNTPISVTPTLWWMESGAPAFFDLPQFRLLPSETRSLDVPSLLKAAGLKDFSGSVNLVFDTQGQTGLLMASGSVDQSNTYVFEVAPRGVASSAGKSLSYWSTGNGDDTMVTIWNPADEVQVFIFRLNFAGGHYDLPMMLEPRATRMFAISEILSGPGPDAEGNVIPTGLQEGSAQIVGSQGENQHILVAIDSGIYNVRKATCNGNCLSCSGASEFNVIIDTFSVAVGGQTQESLIATWNNGNQYDLTGSSSWTSSNTSVATVQTGMVTGVASGQLVVGAGDASEPLDTPQCNSGGVCPSYTGGGGSSNGNVMAIPTNFRYLSAKDAGDGTLSVTYKWDSSSGDLADLSSCTVSESIIGYNPAGGNPYQPQSPPFPIEKSPCGLFFNPYNPTTNPHPDPIPGTDGELVDNHSICSPFVKPYSHLSFTATQNYVYSCSGMTGYLTVPGPNSGPNSIVRSVNQLVGTSYDFLITKTGVPVSATIKPLP